MEIPRIGKRTLLFSAAVGLSIVLLFFVVTASWIGFTVKSECRNARTRYGGTCVEALMALVDDDGRDFRSRNRAVWALGQLGDGRALPVLKKYYTGRVPAREPIDRMMSQRELKKAIRLAAGGLNITAFVWRNGILSGKIE